MTLDGIDAALSGWRERLRAAGENLLGLSETDAYRRLRGEGGWPKAVLAGATAAYAAPLLADLHELWADFGRLTDVIDRASNLRQGVSRLFPSRQTLDEIAGLLDGPSVRLPAEATPLAGRGLLGPAETEPAVTPAELLAAMTRRFDAARDAVVAVGVAWDRVPLALDRLAADTAGLEPPAGPVADELAGLRAALAELRRTADADPLGADARLPALAARAAAVRGSLAAAGRERDQLRAAVADARVLLERVTAAVRESEQAAAERRLKVAADGIPEPPDADRAAALGPWLDRLATGPATPSAVRIGLEKWTAAAGGLLDQAEAARDEARRLLDRRRDLRGLFDALRAKAAAAGRAEDPELAELARTADRLLRRPTRLPEAERAVAEYEQRLL